MGSVPGKQDRNPRKLDPAVHLTLRAPQPREAYILAQNPLLQTPLFSSSEIIASESLLLESLSSESLTLDSLSRRESQCGFSLPSDSLPCEFQNEPQSRNRQIIDLRKKWGFRRIQKERLKVCKAALFANFCAKSAVFHTFRCSFWSRVETPLLRRLIIWRFRLCGSF